MRKLLAALILFAAALFVVAALAARLWGSDAGSGIKGVVLDTSCPEPCAEPPPPPQPYTGDGLTVRVRRLPSLRLVSVRHPTDGHFRVRTGPGRYRMRAFVGDPQKPSCWEDEAKHVRVYKGDFTRVRLHVQNACVV